VNKIRTSLYGISALLLVVACAVESTPENSTPSGGMGGSGASAGVGGASTAGSGTAATGGSVAGAGGTGQAGTTGGTGQAGTTGGTGQAGSTGGANQAGAGGAPVAGTGGAAPLAGMGGDSGSAGAAATGGDGVGGSAGAPPMAGAGGSAGGPMIEKPTVITSAQNAWWQVVQATEVTGNADVTVGNTELQTFTGFGGTFNEKGWEALQALSEADRNTAMKMLFDAADGAKFVYGRIPIGASDYATSRYTLNDTAGDNAMNNFSLNRDRMRLIPYIKAAMLVNPNIYFWGSPWTPPPWMKDNNAYDRGNMKSDATTLQAFALYLSRFVEDYGEEGITIRAIHPQNEPGYQQDYPSCGWSGNLMATFIGTHLGPMFQERGITAEIFIGTMSNPTADVSVLNTVMGNSTARSFVKGHGLQWGLFDSYSQANLDENLPIWQTEHKCGNYPWSGGNANMAPNDHAYGVESFGLIRDWIRKGVNMYSAWNMVLDTVGRSLDTVRPWAQNAPITVDVSAKRLILTPTYYVFRHFSQYLDAGAKVLQTNGDTMAFKNPNGSIMVVLYNSGGARQMTVSAGGKSIQFQMPGQGWATVNVQP
jgi:glucosylceramidase